MPDIGYYTLPVIPSFKGIEAATQAALDKAFSDSAKRAGKVYADEHEKAFRSTTVEATKQRGNDSTVANAEKEHAAQAGAKAGEAYNEAFGKARQASTGFGGASGGAEVAAGIATGKAAGQAAGTAYAEEMKKSADDKLPTVGQSIGKALGEGAGKAAGEALTDVLPDMLKGAGLDKLGEQAGGQLGEAIGGHLDEIPGKIKDGFTTARTVIAGASDGIKDAISGIRTSADNARHSTLNIGDGVKVAADALRGLNVDSLTTGIDHVSSMVMQAEPLAKAFGVDISGWTGDINNVVGPAQSLSDAFSLAKSGIAGTAESLAGIAEGSPRVQSALEGIGSAAGGIAAVGLALGGIYLGIQQIRNAGGMNLDTSPAALGLPVGPYTPTATADLPKAGQQQVINPTDLPPSARIPGQKYVATPGSLDPFAALGPAPPPQSHPIVLPPSPFGIDLPGNRLGGEINGPGPKGHDSVLMYGAPGEHMWTADEVDKAGGHGAMYALRALAKSGALSQIAGYETGGAVGDAAMTGRSGLNTGGAQVDTIAIAQAVQREFGISNIGMYRSPDGYNEHSSGEAADVMIPGGNKAMGDAVKNFALSHAGAFGIEYCLWQQTQWNPDGTSSGMGDRGSPTQNHMDHVHIRTQGGGYPPGSGPGQSGAGNAPAGTSSTPAPAARGLKGGGGLSQSGYDLGGPGGAGGGGMVGMGGGGTAGGGGMAAAFGAGGSQAGGMGGSAFDKAGGAGAIGDIGKQFLSDTFGFGTILPGLDKIPGLQMLFGLLGGLGQHGGTGSAGGDKALAAFSGMFGGGSGSAGAMGSLFGMLPHMSRGGAGMSGVAAPDIGGSSAGDALAFPGINFGGGSGDPAAGPQKIDQSTNVTVNGHSSDDITNKVVRELKWAPRLQTYTPPGAG